MDQFQQMPGLFARAGRGIALDGDPLWNSGGKLRHRKKAREKKSRRSAEALAESIRIAVADTLVQIVAQTARSA
jgi:hypothetical protein